MRAPLLHCLSLSKSVRGSLGLEGAYCTESWTTASREEDKGVCCDQKIARADIQLVHLLAHRHPLAVDRHRGRVAITTLLLQASHLLGLSFGDGSLAHIIAATDRQETMARSARPSLLTSNFCSVFVAETAAVAETNSLSPSESPSRAFPLPIHWAWEHRTDA